MTPDPPRGAGSDGDGENDRTTDMRHYIVLNEDDVMGEGEHELDYSSHDSELTDDEEEEGSYDVIAENGDSLVRGRYQMFVPFVVAGDNDNSILEFHGPGPDEEDNNDNESDSIEQLPESTPSSSQCHSNSSNKAEAGEEPSKREIAMTTEKVETIKNAMKNFSLPTSSIPIWAKDISEDAWKTRLTSKLEENTNLDTKDNNAS